MSVPSGSCTCKPTLYGRSPVSLIPDGWWGHLLEMKELLAGYARVSSEQQDLIVQRDGLCTRGR